MVEGVTQSAADNEHAGGPQAYWALFALLEAVIMRRRYTASHVPIYYRG
jgi:hypothetical protein